MVITITCRHARTIHILLISFYTHLHTCSLCGIERKFCTQLTRRHVSNVFFNAELESELGETLLKSVTFFKCDGDKNVVMSQIETARVTKPYAHARSPLCEKKGKLQMYNLCLIMSMIMYMYLQCHVHV